MKYVNQPFPLPKSKEKPGKITILLDLVLL